METLLLEKLLLHRDELADFLPIVEEMDRRAKHPFFNYVPDNHQNRNQKAFHQSDKPIRLPFGGSQSGKSKAVAHEITWWLAERHPWLITPPSPRIYVVSANYRTMQEGVWRHLKVCLPEWLVDSVGPPVPGGFQLPSWVKMKSGAQVDFISGHGEEEARQKCEAAEIDLAIVDEEIGFSVWQALQARRLSRGGKAVISATLYKSEPWILDLIERSHWDDDIAIWEFSTEVAAQRGHVSKRQVEEILSTSTKEDADVRIYGKSRALHGLVYPEFGPMQIVERFPIPADWTRYCAIDPGWRSCAVLWVAVEPDGHAYAYRELLWHGKTAKEIADHIFRVEGWELCENREEGADIWGWQEGVTEDVHCHWIDPAEFGHNPGGGPKLGTLFATDYGLVCTKAWNDKEAGIERTRQAFMTGLDNVPRLRVFSDLEDFRREIRGYRRVRDTNTGANRHARKDEPVKKNDHLMDCLRYICMGGIDFIPLDPVTVAQEKLAREIERIRAAEDMPPLLQRHAIRWRSKDLHGSSQPEHPGGLGDDY